MRVALTVDGALCLGSGMCSRTAPHLFRTGEGVSVPVREFLVDQTDIDAAVDAMHGCPFGAIEVADVG